MPGPLTGLVPACHSPFHADGRLNVEAVDRQADLLRESRITSVFVGGTTGEWASLTVAERKALTERWIKAGKGTMRVAVHVGHNCQADAIELAAHARQAGAAAVAVMAPSFFKPSTIHDLVEFCSPIAAEADPLPFYFYDIPAMTGVRLPMSEFLHEAKFRIPTLKGLKYSNDNMLELQECVRLDDGGFDVLFGSDECLLAGLCLGIRGAVGSTYNFAAPVYHRIQAAFDKGDLATARAEQAKSITLIKTLAEFGFLAASKAVMAMLGVDCGPVRTPLGKLTAAERVALWERLEPLDVFPRPLNKPE
ncbi:MAG: dihydrodipicolinate synthase family protein [Paludisphaera borealis]|uniref:dihydrodipicolinate synthase family protein n=1 Tax=Paludisphaera borealis TaxID=1387353 RepID=UPI002845CBED|nr:dihydrodipicolinate synthase family protein [Paludisphaera borealis]MDR3621188.1 dihydrodipicolinate synthase family protein [Paludisphaera borealis]